MKRVGAIVVVVIFWFAVFTPLSVYAKFLQAYVLSLSPTIQSPLSQDQKVPKKTPAAKDSVYTI